MKLGLAGIGIGAIDGGAFMGKSSVFSIVTGHFRTLYDARNGRIRIRDLAFQIGLPLALAVTSQLFSWRLSEIGNIVVGVSIVAALLCAMATLIFQIRINLQGKPQQHRKGAQLIDEVFANVLWAILVGFFVALLLIITDSFGLLTNEQTAVVVSSVTVFAGTHFIFVVGMCLKRLQSAYDVIAALRAP